MIILNSSAKFLISMKVLFVTDFDGTININDVSFLLLNEMTGGMWHGIDQEFISGKIGSKEAYKKISQYLTPEKERWIECIRRLENLDPSFKLFLKDIKSHGWDVVVVSDGFDIYINEIFKRNGIKDMEIYANKVSFKKRSVEIDFPHSAGDCEECGVCKRDVILKKRKSGYYPIIYIGDGYSDRCGAFYADWVFARRHLSRIFISKGKAFSYLKDFDSVRKWFSRKIKTMIFDLDGTLIDSYSAILKSLKETLLHFGVNPPDDETLKGNVGVPLEKILTEYLGDKKLAKEGKDIFRKRYMENYRSGTKLLYGARTILKDFKNRGYSIGVISNKHDVFVKLILKWKRIMKYVDVAMGESDRIPPKPDPFMIEEVLRITETHKEEAMMVGDTHVDVESAKLTGVEVAGVATGSESPELLYSAKPAHLLFRLKDIERMMKIREELWKN